MSLATTLSELFRNQSSVSRRLTFAGLDVPRKPAARVASGILVSLSCLTLAGLIFFATELNLPHWLTDSASSIEQQTTAKEDLGESKLMLAIQKGTLKEIEVLIPKSDMNAVDADGDTALHYLGYRKSSKGLESVFKALLAAGSDVNAINEFGERPFITAVYSNNKELVELYLKQGRKLTNRMMRNILLFIMRSKGKGKKPSNYF
ncbi:ankyrin repeat domain-containing protein [Exiguobacterium artemiae]